MQDMQTIQNRSNVGNACSVLGAREPSSLRPSADLLHRFPVHRVRHKLPLAGLPSGRVCTAVDAPLDRQRPYLGDVLVRSAKAAVEACEYHFQDGAQLVLLERPGCPAAAVGQRGVLIVRILPAVPHCTANISDVLAA